MSLMPCKECGKHISSEAISCPHCGIPLQEQVDWGRLFLGLFAGPPLLSVVLSALLGPDVFWGSFLFLYVLVAVGLGINGLPKK